MDDIELARADLLERMRARTEMDGECLIWKAGKDAFGYGVANWKLAHQYFATAKGRAHRLAYLLSVGPIPPGLNILHACDRRECVRPEHLRPGTQADNHNDAVSRGRAAPCLMRPHRPERIAEIVRMYKAGMPQRTIAKSLGYKSKSFVGKVIEANGLPPVNTATLKRVDPDARQDAIRRVLAGESVTALAAERGVNTFTVQYWLHRAGAKYLARRWVLLQETP